MTKDKALKLALEALIWTTGSGDFGEGGQAYEGAKNCLFPAITAIKETLAQPEQEPVAWWNDTGTHIDLNVSGRGIPLYTTPPQRTWVGLTDEEILDVNMSTVITLMHDPIICDTDHNIIQLCKAIEARLKEKNT
jgi:hypothetical protein